MKKGKGSIPWGRRVGTRRIRRSLGVKDPKRMTSGEKKTVKDFYMRRAKRRAERSEYQKKYDREWGEYARQKEKPGRKRSGKIIPLEQGLIPKPRQVIELPGGKFKYRTVMKLLAPMPNKKMKNRWSREVKLGEKVHGLKDVIKIDVIVDFSPEFFPKMPKPKMLIDETARIAIMREPSVPAEKYYRANQMWLVRTPDGVPIGISLDGGFIEGCSWFQRQLEGIMDGMRPEERLCQIYVTEPRHLKKNPNVERVPFFKEPTERERKRPELH